MEENNNFPFSDQENEQTSVESTTEEMNRQEPVTEDQTPEMKQEDTVSEPEVQPVQEPQPVQETQPVQEPQSQQNPYAQQAQAYRAQQGYSQQAYQRPGYQQGGYSQRPQQPNVNPYSNQGTYRPYNAQQNYSQNPYYRPPQQGYNQNAQYGQPAYNNPAAPVYNPATPDDSKKSTGKKVFISAIAFLLVAAIVGGAIFLKRVIDHSTLDRGEVTTAVTERNDSKSEKDNKENGDVRIAVSSTPADSNPLSTDKIAEKARESCVGVIVYTNSNSSSEAGQGTGIIMPIEGGGKFTYIITCAHVIDDANISVKVQLEDGTQYEAEIVGYDVRTDVGVLKIKETGLKACEVGDSSALKVGSAVYAVGNPGGIEFFGSFTDGIVSAIDRPIGSEIGYSNSCIQHTAAINPGNSGGALVNVYGQVVGINSQKIASSSYEGMGFAIPINSAVEIANDLINFGYIPDRAKLGITYYALSSSTQYSMIARYNSLPSGTLIINTISDDSAFAGTQVRQYDMIIAVNGKDLDTADVLLEKIEKGKPGDTLKLTICRVNNDYSIDKFDVNVTLVEDRGATEEKTTTQPSLDPFGDFGYNFGWGN